ncbi:MAG: M23 family metallopeptidase [Dermatophilaceae bacterium]
MSARSYDARHRGYDARHRSPKCAPSKPRRLFAGLALPTAAATALTFTATGAAMATSNHPQSGNKIASASVSATVQTDDSRTQARQASALAREHAAFAASRTAKRQDILDRDLAARREQRAHSWQLPITSYALTSSFGFRWGRLHAGEDFASPVGTRLVSMSTGTVTFAGQESGYGNIVKIRYWDGTVTFYGHMSHLLVTQGEGVDPGEIVGASGNTGESTGPHLHLEIHPNGGAPVDPLPWLTEHRISA